MVDQSLETVEMRTLWSTVLDLKTLFPESTAKNMSLKRADSVLWCVLNPDWDISKMLDSSGRPSAGSKQFVPSWRSACS